MSSHILNCLAVFSEIQKWIAVCMSTTRQKPSNPKSKFLLVYMLIGEKRSMRYFQQDLVFIKNHVLSSVTTTYSIHNAITPKQSFPVNNQTGPLFVVCFGWKAKQKKKILHRWWRGCQIQLCFNGYSCHQTHLYAFRSCCFINVQREKKHLWKSNTNSSLAVMWVT